MRPDELFIARWSEREHWAERAVASGAIAERLYRRLSRRPVLLRRPWPEHIRTWITKRLEMQQHTLHMLISTTGDGRRCLAKAFVTSAAMTLKPESFDVLQHDGWRPLTYLVEWPQPLRRLHRR